MSPRNSGISLVITVIAGMGASLFFYLKTKIDFAEHAAGEARLKLLEAQLEPHMLFNTLANLRALIAIDPPRAITMLDHLNDYLRLTLSGSRSVSHPLAREFERLRDYLELMSLRMGPRLRYALDLPEALREQSVPPLLLQPLVENAIRHGLEPQVEGGEIRVSARRDGARVRIEVSDSGVGIDPAAAAGGFGLAQVRERLHTVYGVDGGLTLTARANGGTRAVIHMPASA
jgi:LytS/YehU family sensor histidine kinase